jgi:hypothetical protein
MATTAPRSFRSWLISQLEEQAIPRRELARRLAARHPEGITPQTIETYRRAIYRYLDVTEPMLPNLQTRSAFAAALGVSPSEVPSTDDEEGEPDLSATLQALAREQAELSRKLTRALRAVKS